MPESHVAEVGSWDVVYDFGEPICLANFHPDGDLVSAFGCGMTSLDGVIDLETRSPLWWGGLETFLLPLSFSPDGSLLAATGLGGELMMLDVEAIRAGTPPEDAILWMREAHEGWLGMNSLFGDDGSVFVSLGSNDKRIRVWDASDGTLIADLMETGLDWAAFDVHPDGDAVLVEGPNGSLRLVTLDTEELVSLARDRLTRSLTEDECEKFRFESCPSLEELKSS